ncbi:hypothetical protein IX317_000649 [Fusobacterium sp. DD29]|uniref:phage tail protein n=1 Tax=unclassified Fusobacterium TaxID=2648384 RepID=UPI001B8B3470|nr:MULTISPECIES: phage tail protein [unclassified Fusobacterium]MBR8700229.1 hypothetical protein [Fusobacterium sp. DD45]MBR8710516.1 hypothetical protein [Fusobacterium sp. DD28]MBR8748988.1 hypothetical protein [Fusobacterium sp. DD29]MBR8751034.1 hypothetical protein [Fusobacterium sp. DD26]MBR8761294.1 hypothetical protein [Fusobacterium sp. DD25]
MMIGSLGNIIFRVSSMDVFSISNEIEKTVRARITEHTPVYGITQLRHQGRDPVEIKFEIELISSLSLLTPSIQLKQLEDFMYSGKYAPLVIGMQVMGQYPFVITEVTKIARHYNPLIGDFDNIKLEVNLKEYVDIPEYYQSYDEYFKNKAERLSRVGQNEYAENLLKEEDKDKIIAQQKKVK